MSLEAAYEKCNHATNLVVEEEKARLLRLQVVLLEDENDELNEQLLREDDRIERLESAAQDMQQRLDGAEKDNEHLRGQLRAKTRDVDFLKVRLTTNLGPGGG